MPGYVQRGLGLIQKNRKTHTKTTHHTDKHTHPPTHTHTHTHTQVFSNDHIQVNLTRTVAAAWSQLLSQGHSCCLELESVTVLS